VSWNGDSTLSSAFVLGAYVWAASIAWRRAEKHYQKRWFLISIATLALALGYQVDGIPALIIVLKAQAKSSGWYHYRWPLASLSLQILGVILVTISFQYRRILRSVAYHNFLTLIGAAWLLAYFLLRATSLHWVAPWIGMHFGCPRTNPWIELIGALLLASGFALGQKAINRTPAEAGASPHKPFSPQPL
jgi:hypothetical protein